MRTKYKLSYFQKLFVYSIVIVLFAGTITNFFNVYFLDSFFQWSKKQQIPRIIEYFIEIKDNRMQVISYAEEVKERFGVNVIVSRPKIIMRDEVIIPMSMDALLNANFEDFPTHEIENEIIVDNTDDKINRALLKGEAPSEKTTTTIESKENKQPSTELENIINSEDTPKIDPSQKYLKSVNGKLQFVTESELESLRKVTDNHQQMRESKVTINSMGKMMGMRKLLETNEIQQIPKHLVDNFPPNQFVTLVLPGGIDVIAYRVELLDGTDIVALASLGIMEQYKVEIRILQGIATLFASILVVFLGSWFSKRMTRDITKLNIAAKKISRLNFVESVGIKREDEIGELSESVELMSKNLKESMDKLKMFVSNASHELKTPISVISMVTQNLKSNKNVSDEEYNHALDTILKESDEMRDLIENLMTLSKLSYNKYKIEISEINLYSEIKEIVEKLELLELENDLEVVNKVRKDKIIKSDEKILKIALKNLIQNSLKYATYGSEINIYEEDGKVVIENSYLGDEIIDVGKLTQPFVRGEGESASKEGSGLGLSIADTAFRALDIKYSIEAKDNKFKVSISI